MNLTEAATKLKADIDEASQEVSEPRWHLGASEIGDECLRRVWYKFRWVKHEQVSGRIQRLFKRGHREENTFTELLNTVGISVLQHDPATGKQWLGSALFGHYGGSADGISTVPEKYLDGAEQRQFLTEFKTHNLKSFNDLVKQGVKLSKPKHYIQMCVYGAFFNLDMGLYVAVCKDNDDLHLEFVPLSRDVAEDAHRKAELLITASEPPPRISNKPSFFVCKMCHLSGVCHRGTPADKNCRSCRFAVPSSAGNAAWHCDKWNGIIPREIASEGCVEWQTIV